MKKASLIIGLLVLFIVGCTAEPQGIAVGEPYGTDPGTGKVVVAMTDAAADMGAVSEIRVTIDSVQIQSETEGWLTLSSEQKTVDLLNLKAEAKNALLANINIKEGNYNQLRLEISEVIVVDDKGEHEAKLPSGDLKINSNMEVKESTTATALLDVIADESLHITGNGQYILAPVIQVETRADAQATINGDAVEISGGTLKTKATVGMNAEGRIEIGGNIPVDADISIGDGKVVVKAGTKKNATNKTSIEADIDAGIEIG